MENGIKRFDNFIGKNRENISSLIMKRDFMKFEDKLKLNNKAIGKNCEKIYNLNATFDLRLYEVETNCNKLLTTSLKL